MNTNFYDTLEVPIGTSSEQLRKAYFYLVKVWHPDRFANDPDLQLHAQEKLKAINEAYATLSDSTERRNYDSELARTNHQPINSAPSQPAPPNIHVTQKSLNFGTITKGDAKSLSFIIKNNGGPIKNYQIGWVKSPNWANAKVSENSKYTFPVKVDVSLNSDPYVGNHKDTIIVVVDGNVCAQIPVSVVVKPYDSPILLSPEYSTIVDYDQPLEVGYKNCNLDYNRFEQIEYLKGYDFCSPEKSGQIITNIVLVNIRRGVWRMGTRALLNELEKQNFRPANLRELLALGATYPNLQRENDIFGLGATSRMARSGGVGVAYLSADVAKKRRLNIVNFFRPLGSNDRFAAVKK